MVNVLTRENAEKLLDPGYSHLYGCRMTPTTTYPTPLHVELVCYHCGHLFDVDVIEEGLEPGDLQHGDPGTCLDCQPRIWAHSSANPKIGG